MKSPELIENEFKEWLTSNPELIFSSNCNSSNCPISQYLEDTTKSHWYVSRYNYHDNSGNIYELPEWTQNFIEEFDGYRFRTQKDVSSAMALSFLSQN